MRAAPQSELLHVQPHFPSSFDEAEPPVRTLPVTTPPRDPTLLQIGMDQLSPSRGVALVGLPGKGLQHPDNSVWV